MIVKRFYAVLFLIAVLCCPTSILAATSWKVHDFACDNCHKQGVDLTTLAGMVCLNCHKTGVTAGDNLAHLDAPIGTTIKIPSKNFKIGMASDAMGSRTKELGVGAIVTEAPGFQSSHNWAASDVNPSAGASAPTDSRFNGQKNASGARVSCSRCHDPHGSAVSYTVGGMWGVPLTTVDANPKLLKLGVGSENAMCVDCHTAWNLDSKGITGQPNDTQNAWLTHPLVTNYPGFESAKAAQALIDGIPSKYKPFNGNGDMVLGAGGDITCTTCHGTHLADSRAATVDGVDPMTTPGDGFILKGNGRMSGDTVGICTSCHVYKAHGTGKVGCIDCHSGHSYNNGTPNFFILRDTVSLPTWPTNPATNPGTNLSYTTATTAWKNGGNGYCEGCHTLPATHNGLTAGGQLECNACHTHSDTASFTAGACNQCHGNPPVDDSKGAGTVGSTSTGRAYDPVTGWDYSNTTQNSFIKSELLSSHAKHAGSAPGQYAINCDDCHNGKTHKSGTFQDVFKTPISKVTSNGQLVTSYAPAGDGTCSAVYCHSNGGPRGAVPTADTGLTWQNGASKACSSCHGNDAISMNTKGNSAAHQSHLGAATSLLGKTFSCAVCHKNTATDLNTLATGAVGVNGSHVNAVKDVVSNMAASGVGAVDFTYNGTATGTCSAVYCHSDGKGNYKTPDWDTATIATCTSCHNNGTDSGIITDAAPNSGAHATHVSDANGPKLSCDTCHTHNGTTGTTADHIDGFARAITNYQTTVCNVCHGIDGTEVAPNWTTPGSDDCVTCHSGTSRSTINTITAPDKSSALTTGHNKVGGTYAVSGYGGASQTCEACHDKAATHLTGTGNKRLKAAFSCDSCHGTAGTATVKNINTHQLKSCLTCHDPHGTTNIYMVKPTSPGVGNYNGTVVFSARTGADSFDEVDTNNADDICATCHTAANQTKQHNNKDNLGTHAAGNKQGADCMTCHKAHTDPVNAFAVGAGTSCDGCHGFPPTIATGSTTDIHINHSITTGNTIATSDRTDCAVCHTGADSYTYDPTADQAVSLNHSNATNRPGIITAAVGFNPTDKTCASACHTSTVVNGGTWNAGATLACDACHYYEATPTSANNTLAGTKGLTGTHPKHFDANKTCADCHAVPSVVNGHISVAATGTDAQKIQGMAVATQNEAAILATVGNGNGAANATCALVCHNPSATTYSATWTVPNAVGCAFCHSDTDPATKLHTSHLSSSTAYGKTIVCTECHVDNGAITAHLNGVVDVTGSLISTTTPYVNSATTCTNTCHQNGRAGAPVAAVNWNMAAKAPVDCAICHAQQPATGSHGKHLAAIKNPAASTTAKIDCASCHDTTVEGASATAQHLDFNIDVLETAADPTVPGYTQNKAPLGSAFEKCSNSSCHTDGTTATPVTTPFWGDGTGANCTACHTTMSTNGPASGSHGQHMTSALVTTTVACTDCHATGTDPVTNIQPAAGHRDGNIDTNVALKYAQTPLTGPFTDKLIGSGFVSCEAASCHDNGLGAKIKTPAWGVTPAPAACTICHLAAPGTASHSFHLSAIKDPKTAPTVNIACGDCHNGALQGTNPGASHLNNTVEVLNGYVNSPANKGNQTWTTCATAACHVSAQGLTGTTAGVQVATPVWGDNNTRCSACHEASPTTAKHDEHLLSYGAVCADCHAGAVLDTVTVANSNGGTFHRNGDIDVLASLNYSQVGPQAPGDGWGSCANPNVSCHSTAESRPWDNSAGGCTTCHGGSGTSGAPLVTGDLLKTPFGVSGHTEGQHTKHTVTKTYGCATCHSGNGMPTTDSVFTMAFTGLAAGGKYVGDSNIGGGYSYNTTSPDISTAAGKQDCSNIYCHSTGQSLNGLSATPVYATPSWSSAATGQCGTCHAGDGASGNLSRIATGSHSAHLDAIANPVASTTTKIACSDCHNVSSTAHVNQAIDLVGVTYTAANTLGDGYGTCSTASCHDNGTGTLVPTKTWGTTAACTECHTTMTANGPATGSHNIHMTTGGATCASCHDAATSPAGPNGTEPAVGHRDGNLDVTQGYTNTTKGGTYGTCTASCHITNRNTTGLTKQWGQVITNCTECHTTPPTGDTHNAHLTAKTTSQVFGQVIDCASCHQSATTATTAPGAGEHRNQHIDATVGGYAVKFISPTNDQSYYTCATAACHRNGQNLTLGTDARVTATFEDLTPANCTQCHTNGTLSASHSNHIDAPSNFDCSVCHVGATKDASYSLIAHGDGNVDVAVSATYSTGSNYTPNKAYGSAKVSCAAVSCHGDGQTTAGKTTPVWGTPAGCAACHMDNVGANLLVSGSHAEHLGSLIKAGITCANCHVNADPTAPTPVAPLRHGDGKIEVTGYAVNVVVGATARLTGDTCSAVSCHEDGTGATKTTPAWGTATTACAECHGAVPTTNKHSLHLGLSGVTCGTCHPGADSATYAETTAHINNTIDINAGFNYDDNTTVAGNQSGKGAPYGTCATASCHNNGQGVSVASPNWATGTTTCNSCHNTTPTTGSHSAHFNNTEAGSISCGNCHGNAVVNSSPITTPAGLHTNNNVDVFDVTQTGATGVTDLGYVRTAALGTASWSTCNAALCHDDGTGTLVQTPAWSNASSNCIECHTSMTATGPATGAHATHMNAVTNGLIASLDCVNCHSDAVFDATTPANSKGATGEHRDTNLDVYNTVPGDLGYAANVATSAPSYTTYTCNTSYCHGDKIESPTNLGTFYAPTGVNSSAAISSAPRWGDTGTGCTFCHGMPPVPTVGLVIGAHSVGQALSTCQGCHGAGKGDINSTGTGFTNGGATHINHVINGGGNNCNDCHSTVGGTGNGPTSLSAGHRAHVFTAYTGTISNGDYGNYSTNGWYNSNYIDDANDVGKRKLNLGCGYCHPQSNPNHTTGAVVVDLSNNDTGVSAVPGGTGYRKSLNGAATYNNLGVCDNVYCHSDGNGTFVSSPAWSTADGVTGTDCTLCHGNSPATGAHSVHTVGIHYTDLYDSDRVGVMNTAAATLAAHGNAATATTITCVICHGNTVSLSQNDQDTTCAGCHGTTAPNMGILGIKAFSNTHVNGIKDVAFNLTGFKTTAQLRDDITSVTELNTNWTRTNGYKQATGTSHDSAKAVTPSFTGGTCSAIVCHNGNSANWSDSTAGNCQKCHTALPQ